MKLRSYYLLLIPATILVLTIWGHYKERHEIKINENSVFVKIAKTSLEKSNGLMNVKFMPENEGMLFLYDAPGRHSFWMKQTFIPLDMIWLNSDKRVVYIEHSAAPCLQSPCPSYLPDVNTAKYVIELNGGWARKYNLNVGDIVNLNP